MEAKYWFQLSREVMPAIILSCRVKPGRGAVRVGELLWDFVNGKEAGNFRFPYFCSHSISKPTSLFARTMFLLIPFFNPTIVEEQ